MTAPAGGAEQEIEGESLSTGTYVISWTGTATCTVDGVAKSSGDTFSLTEGTNCTVRFSSGTFTDVQLEIGSISTPFEQRSIGEELALCQRYYCKSYEKGTAPGSASLVGCAAYIAATTSNLAGTVIFPTTMRAIPTITIYDYAGTADRISLLTATTSVSGTSVAQAGSFSENGFNRVDNGTSPFTAGTGYRFNWTADAEL
jgi:hypothetical protein